MRKQADEDTEMILKQQITPIHRAMLNRTIAYDKFSWKPTTKPGEYALGIGHARVQNPGDDARHLNKEIMMCCFCCIRNGKDNVCYQQ